jgi:hypothetical protein
MGLACVFAGDFIEVWKKQPDGTGKAVDDTCHSDLPT